jgi:hypothetical protein
MVMIEPSLELTIELATGDVSEDACDERAKALMLRRSPRGT